MAYRQVLDAAQCKEGEAKGRAEAEAMAQLETLKRLLSEKATVVLSDDAIARIAGVSIEVVAAARRTLG